MRHLNARRGSLLLEFSLTSIPIVFVLISLFWISFGMWQYHTMAEAVNVTARAASVHGAGCVGKTCATTVDSTARSLATSAVGIVPSQVNVTLTSSASSVTCNPLNTCFGNTAAWPTLSGNTVSTDVAVMATFQLATPISMWVPRNGGRTFGSVTLGANSRQPVAY